MGVYAIICEYNPFHNGHKYMIEQIKKDGDAVIAVMSGSFTQRGDTAIADKFFRAETAAKNGADLVIELPTVYACACAEAFATGGVRLINSLGVVDKLCFGVENNDIKLLNLAADAFEDAEFKAELKRNMDNGEYYPRAVTKAISKVFSPALSEVIDKPNNILAIEYLKALKNTPIKPFTVKRKGAAHDSAEAQNNIASASRIRELVLKSEDYRNLVPDYIINNPADTKNLEQAILYKLRTMSKEEIKKLPDVGEGLENRIFEAARTSTIINELLGKTKTKRYTMARIRRILVYALLNITEDLPKSAPPYVRVLAFNGKGRELLTDIKKKCSLPLITNVADGYNSLDNKSKRIFDIDILATDVHALALKEKGICGTDFTKGVIKV